MLNEMFNDIAGESERRVPARRIPYPRAIRAGSGDRRAVVQLRRVRSEQSGRSHPLSWNEATMRTALSRIITY
jgi:hypothetical protein